MLRELARHFAARTSFAFETTLSGRGYLRLARQSQAAGYRVKLIFLQLPSAEEAIARIAQRIRRGGHAIPESVMRCHFAAGKDICERLHAPLVDASALYDNAGAMLVLVDSMRKSMNKNPIDQDHDRDLRLSQQAMERAAQRAHDLACRQGPPLSLAEVVSSNT